MSNIIDGYMSLTDDFARAFGDALKRFLDHRGTSYASAARRLGVTNATLSTYWTNDKKGKRRKPRAELLFRACTELEGFVFDYKGYRVTAEGIGKPRKASAPMPEQFGFDFSRQFKLTEGNGQVAVNLKRRHPGKLEVSVSLKAAS